MRILFIIVAMLILGGCATTKTVDPNLEIEPYNKTSKLPYILAINGQKLTGAQITANPGTIELTAIYGDALLESLKHNLKNSYENVYIIRSEQDINKFDDLLTVSNNITSSCGTISCGFNSKTSVNLTNKNKIILLDGDVTDTFTWHQPGGASALNFLTGFTLFVTSPILIPASVSISGDELKKQVSDSNDRIASALAVKIMDASKNSIVPSKSKDSISTRLEKLKELLDNGLIAKDGYEIKQKEILNSL